MYRYGLKRMLDITASAAAMALLSPLMLAVAAAIKIWDPGPVIFRQTRVGAGGRLFDFYKFRSMPVGTGDLSSDQIGEVTLTWVGRFIRRTNIDELPQLWNILKGDMSIVGPRPPLPSQHELLALRELSGAINCRPGLTGLAQVRSFDGMTVPEKAGFDAEYASRISFGTDAAIVLRTFLYLLKPPPRY